MREIRMLWEAFDTFVRDRVSEIRKHQALTQARDAHIQEVKQRLLKHGVETRSYSQSTLLSLKVDQAEALADKLDKSAERARIQDANNR